MISPYAAYAFDSLFARLTHKSPIGLSRLKALCGVEEQDQHCPLFVTWNTITDDAEDKSLRGCIGNFGNLELESGIKEYALIAALEDTRFEPIVPEELPSLECDVTLLKHFEKADNPLDWELGKHGVRISFSSSHQQFSATFLPDVAVEQGWDKNETLDHLVRKAGSRGDWRNLDIILTRYQGIKTSITYGEYVTLRGQLGLK
ncbi:unnamed protein product [Kuraishia capsulata CBS 1993]|uniref:AMMECR1 domain-containing protein n=1 Tax=Kuraishia capsulata CBS 1993 TaxID=1382522 RepID=W6MRM1_9ASCO|nr:uncharacterized protein KUCA_T00000443001 [Kuraishia capsulata CBS 1993]CDK24480.1 unnamed protein product [Kuraishia capsulata CBS 1993]